MLRRVVLEGFRSIKGMDLELETLNILIGANGAGKSNLVSFFKMINEMMGERLQEYISAAGRAQSILHFGPKATPQMTAQLEFEGDKGKNTYSMRLVYGADDSLFFADESFSYHLKNYPQPRKISLGRPGHYETEIRKDEGSYKTMSFMLKGCRVFHFHDTSSTARVRQHCYVDNDHWLMPDAGNIAAILLRLQNEDGGKAYKRIVMTIRQIAPFFGDFVLEPQGPVKNQVSLKWRHKGSDEVFGPHQFSDGTLRAICLTTLLLQPVDELPALIIVDEPEIGLHPYALNVVASMFKTASHHAQVLISTQSSSFLDNFDPENVIVVKQEGKESQFNRLETQELKGWLEEYSLGELLEKNVLSGGGPH